MNTFQQFVDQKVINEIFQNKANIKIECQKEGKEKDAFIQSCNVYADGKHVFGGKFQKEGGYKKLTLYPLDELRYVVIHDPMESFSLTMQGLLELLKQNNPDVVDMRELRNTIMLLSSKNVNNYQSPQFYSRTEFSPYRPNIKDDMKQFEREKEELYKNQQKARINNLFDMGLKNMLKQLNAASSDKYKLSGNDMLIKEKPFADMEMGKDIKVASSKDFSAPDKDYQQKTKNLIRGFKNMRQNKLFQAKQSLQDKFVN